jgi:amidohydrolase
VDWQQIRHRLHNAAELSGREGNTSRIVRSLLETFDPDQLLHGIGGHGLAAVFGDSAHGPRVLLRSELDALPIDESIDLPHKSATANVSHKCGHDGHMTMLAGVAHQLSQDRPKRGSVVLLFQPAEETGEGAERVLADPAFETIRPDFAIALHNLPGYPLGHVILRSGVFAAASSGLIAELKGATSHAAEPHRGRSPALAVAELIQAISAAPQYFTALYESAQATLIHARVGQVAFGTSPGEGTVMATLRSYSDTTMRSLRTRIMSLARDIAAAHQLEIAIRTTEVFPVTENDPDVAEIVQTAAEQLGLTVHRPEVPFAWSEDFGHFTAACPGALFGLGAGENHPALHNPDYDFPDELLPVGINTLSAAARRLLQR